MTPETARLATACHLAKDLDCSVDTVLLALAKLEARGLIALLAPDRSKGRRDRG